MLHMYTQRYSTINITIGYNYTGVLASEANYCRLSPKPLVLPHALDHGVEAILFRARQDVREKRLLHVLRCQ